MADTIRRADLDVQFEHYHDTLLRNRLIADEVLILDDNAHGWNLHVRNPDTGGWSDPPVGPAYLGGTKAEAYRSLVTRSRAINDTIAILAKQGRLA